MKITLTNPWEHHVVNGVGILNNPWGLDWNRSDRDYGLQVSHEADTNVFGFSWSTINVAFDPAQVLAYPEAYWGIADVAFREAIPYPDFMADLNGESDRDVYISTEFVGESVNRGARNNYAIESFRFSGLPRKDSARTTTHEIMLWLQKPTDESIGLGVLVEDKIIFNGIGPFSAYRKNGEPKYLAFIYDGIDSLENTEINWSEVLRRAGDMFQKEHNLHAYDPNDRFYSIEAGPEIYGGSSRTLKVQHEVFPKARELFVPEDQTPPIINSEKTATFLYLQAQAALTNMYVQACKDNKRMARVQHGIVDSKLADFYNLFLKELPNSDIQSLFAIEEKGTHTLGSEKDPYPENPAHDQ